jgi:hypothetical protein
LILIFVLSTACLTLFPHSSEPTPTSEWDEPEREPLEFNPSSLPNAKVDVPYVVEIKVTKNVTPVGDFMIDPNILPPGLELIILEDVADTARITGVPEKAGTYTFTINVWCYGTMVSGQMGSKEYTIVVE